MISTLCSTEFADNLEFLIHGKDLRNKEWVGKNNRNCVTCIINCTCFTEDYKSVFSSHKIKNIFHFIYKIKININKRKQNSHTIEMITQGVVSSVGIKCHFYLTFLLLHIIQKTDQRELFNYVRMAKRIGNFRSFVSSVLCVRIGATIE